MVVNGDKISCVVVTFNRKKCLYENLHALLSQTRKVDEIIIVDNASTDGTYGYIKDILDANSNVFYYNMKKNTGGAGGFSWGIKRAYERGADYIWGMDDDAVPATTALERIVSARDEIGELAALWSNCDQKCEKDITQVYTWMFVGFFLPKIIISKIGFPRYDYFIYWDDHEYAMRIQRAGYKIYKIKDSIIYHKDASSVYYPEKKVGPFSFKMFDMPGWKRYYYYRNKILTYGWTNKNKYCIIFGEIPRNIIKCFVYHNKQAGIILTALIDGVTGRSGKRMDPK